MEKRWDHGLTVAFSVVSRNEEMPTVEEALAGLLKRVAHLLTDHAEAAEALLSERPFDTFEVTQ